MEVLLLITICFAFYGIGAVYSYFTDTANRAKIRKEELERLIKEKESISKKVREQEEKLKELPKQYSQGFPLLAQAIEEYLNLYDGQYAKYLETKKHPALKSAEIVSYYSKIKNEAIKKAKIAEHQVIFYESVFPFLQELKEQVPTEEDIEMLLSDYTEEEREDPVSKYLTKEEYRKLPTSEKNQMALDRYWDNRHKSLWSIGKIYESYIGFIYEQDGWEVEYFGIDKRYDDLGRDLIAIKDNVHHIVQCKNWSKYKTIYENHIFQLFGTTYSYAQKFKNAEVIPVFYTSTSLSETAKEFSRRLGIEVNEEVKLIRYPCIKCNISNVTNEKIYHLPFDQQYDKTKINPKLGEMYCTTVNEAEQAGFRRAFKWRGTK